MKIDPITGLAEMEYAYEDIPAAMHNAQVWAEAQEALAWIRVKIGVPPDAQMFKGEKTIAGQLHVICSHSDGYMKYITSYKCNDKQGEIARQSVRIAELETEKRALEQRCQAQYVGMKCYSCGVKWKLEIHNESCDMSHREHWAHEWVGQRVLDLTKLLSDANNEIKRLKTELSKWHPTTPKFR